MKITLGQTNKKINENLELWKVCIGSHMWGMERPDSDVDYVSIYLMSGDKFLIGTRSNNFFTQDKEKKIDHQRHEIGKCISEIKKMNVNFVWAVMSPIIKSQHRNWLQQLRQLVVENPSKQIFYSVKGMAKNNIKRFIESGEKNTAKYFKKLNQISRSVNFAINYFLYGKFLFEKTSIKTKNELDLLMEKLQRLYEQSNYPDHPNPEPFNKYLKKIRLYSLRLSELI